MGKAAVDLPDPLQKPAAKGSPASAASADDLLSQMAGDEIDRLLAEADVERPAKSADSAPTAAPDAEIPRAQASPAAAAAPPQTPAQRQAAMAAEAEEALGAELDSLFAELQKDPSGVLASTTAAAVAEAASTPAPQSAPPVAASATALHEADETEHGAPKEAPPPSAEVDSRSGEKAALLAAAGFDTDSEEDIDAPVGELLHADVEIRSARERGLPIYLKPLVWINAPFAGCSESMRNVLGKLGILTLLNAVAVIAYVMIVRKHH